MKFAFRSVTTKIKFEEEQEALTSRTITNRDIQRVIEEEKEDQGDEHEINSENKKEEKK